jgi:hypothetical protein
VFIETAATVFIQNHIAKVTAATLVCLFLRDSFTLGFPNQLVAYYDSDLNSLRIALVLWEC